jgi:hypothetical protein
MTETDAEDRLASHKAADVVDGVGARLGISRAIREKNAVGFQSENVFCRGLRGNYRDATTFTA